MKRTVSDLFRNKPGLGSKRLSSGQSPVHIVYSMNDSNTVNVRSMALLLRTVGHALPAGLDPRKLDKISTSSIIMSSENLKLLQNPYKTSVGVLREFCGKNVNVHLVGGGHKILRPEQFRDHKGMDKGEHDTRKNREERDQAFHWITRLIATGRTEPLRPAKKQHRAGSVGK